MDLPAELTEQLIKIFYFNLRYGRSETLLAVVNLDEIRQKEKKHYYQIDSVEVHHTRLDGCDFLNGISSRYTRNKFECFNQLGELIDANKLGKATYVAIFGDPKVRFERHNADKVYVYVSANKDPWWCIQTTPFNVTAFLRQYKLNKVNDEISG